MAGPDQESDVGIDAGEQDVAELLDLAEDGRCRGGTGLLADNSRAAVSRFQPVALQPGDFGVQGIAAKGKRPQARPLNRQQVRPPPAGLIRLDVTGAADRDSAE
jgi:hypothetical protein